MKHRWSNYGIVFMRFFILMFLLFAWWGPVAAWGQGWELSWPHERSRLKPDEKVLWGRLSNGLRYALLDHAGAPGKVSIKLLVLVGSIEEREEELGLAHFIEHMAFNGSRNFEPGELASFFQQSGMEYGKDLNAGTTFDYTLYGLEFWENDDELLKKGLLFLRDIGDGIHFLEREIDMERKVVLSEMRSRDGMVYRAKVDSFKLFFNGLTFTKRLPIGTTERINNLSREQFLHFYRKWYRPDLMVLVAAGDVRSPKMAGWVKALFGDMKAPSAALPPRNVGKLQRQRALRAASYRISDVNSTNVQAASVVAARKVADSMEVRKQRANRSFAMALLQQRMHKTIRSGAVGGAEYTQFSGYDIAMASIEVGGAQWADGVKDLDRAIRVSLEKGFTEKDINKLRERELSKIHKMRTYAPKMDPSMISEKLAMSIYEGKVYVGIEEELKWREAFLRQLTAKTAHRSFRECWDFDHMSFHLSGAVPEDATSSKIKKEVAKGRSEQAYVNQYLYQSESEFMPIKWGPRGTVVESKTIPEFGAELMKLSNNVRLNFIESDSEPGLAMALVRVGGGLFDLNEDKPGLREFALRAFLQSGTSRYEASQVLSFLRSPNVSFGFDLKDHDAFSFKGQFGSEDLDYFLGVVTELLHRPRIHRSSFQNARIVSALSRSSSSIGMGEGYRAFEDYLHKGDGRFAWGTYNDYAALGVTSVRNWMQDSLAHGYIEVSIVGDLDKATVVESMSRTLGSLAERRDAKINPVSLSPVNIDAPPGYHKLEFVGEEHLAMAVGYWPTFERLTIRDRIALEVLSNLVERRLWDRLREELGVSYSPQAEFKHFVEYPEFAFIEAKIDCSPDEAPAIAQALLDISEKIGKNGIPEDQADEFIGPLKFKLRHAMKSNHFLLDTVLKRAQERPDSIQDAIELKEYVFTAETIREVNAIAKTLLTPENSRAAAISPKPLIGLFQMNAILPQ